ncbi:MAG: NUDIX hydrolase [Clostridia bacterium]|nr:NUDIX hydrolase [Clostridia bacterium]
MDSEKEFLQKYNMDDYERPSVTSDIIAFTIKFTEEDSYRHNPDGALQILLIKRKGYPFKDHWALPGGFLQPDETIEECAYREVFEETGVKPASLMLTGIYSDPNRDPRGWIISNAFATILSDKDINATAGDDASEALWFNIAFNCDTDNTYTLTLTHDDIVITATLKEKETKFGKTDFVIQNSGELAFDHAKIIATALTVLRSSAEKFELIFDFLPEKFTLSALQQVQETIMNISVLSANFRRKISSLVQETDEYTTGAGHRPAKLFTKKHL